MESAEKKHQADAAALASKHEKETAELEDTRFALFEEFDAKREAWAATKKGLFEEEGSKHAESVEKLVAQKSAEDRAVLWHWPPQEERNRRHTERLGSLEVDYKLRQMELTKQQRPSRVKIEEQYQIRFVEMQRSRAQIQQCQLREVEMLVEEHKSTIAAILAAFEAVEIEVQEESRRVDDWWFHLDTEAAAHIVQIDEEERSTLHDVVRLKTAVSADEDAENIAASFDVQSIAPAAVANFPAVDIETMPKGTDTTAPSDISANTGDGNSGEFKPNASQAVFDVPVTELPVGQVADTATALPIIGVGNHASALTTNSDDSGIPVMPPACTTEKPNSSLINDNRTTLPSPIPAEVDGRPSSTNQILSNPDSHLAHVEVDPTRTGRKRSSSAESFSSGSDFVEI